VPNNALNRAVLFVDGNNWYHGLDRIGESASRLDYVKLSTKLVGARTWSGTRYYVGQLEQTGNKTLYAEQRKFLAALRAQDPRRISVHLGRIERVPTENPMVDELRHFLSIQTTGMDVDVRHRLELMANRYERIETYKEKASDVYLATDLVRMAGTNGYETAYVLSADGDYTPAVQYVCSLGKKVFAVSAQPGAQLAKVVTKFIPIKSEWLRDCY
jgi:uncharacterized LabA/DUF88 family protein